MLHQARGLRVTEFGGAGGRFLECKQDYLLRKTRMKALHSNQSGSTELVVLGLLAALIVVLAIPLLGDVNPAIAKHQMSDKLSTMDSHVVPESR